MSETNATNSLLNECFRVCVCAVQQSEHRICIHIVNNKIIIVFVFRLFIT